MSEEKEFNLLLNSLSMIDDLNDVKAMESRLQTICNQNKILQQKDKKNMIEMKRLKQQILDINKEKLKTKTQLLDLSFKRDLAENKTNIIQKELNELKDELKLKNILLNNFDNEKKKSINSYKTTVKRSSSYKDIPLLCHQNKQFITVENKSIIVSNDIKEREKTIVLQRLLLSKCKQLSEMEIVLEEYQKQFNQMKEQINRLSQTKRLAQLLTNTRHELNLKTNQLKEIRLQLNEFQQKLDVCLKDNHNLREKLHKTYKKTNY